MDLVEELVGLLRHTQNRNPWVRATLEQHIKAGDRAAFDEHCAGLVNNVVSGQLPEGVLVVVTEKLWRDMALSLAGAPR